LRRVCGSVGNEKPPNNFGAVVAANSEKKMKILEQMKTIRTLFNRLKKICDKLDEVAEDPEDRTLESWIPMKGVENEFQNYKDSDAYRAANEERRELLEVNKIEVFAECSSLW
ncbi:hypothetical protein QYM36_015558, partial [Artemia franciscana]